MQIEKTQLAAEITPAKVWYKSKTVWYSAAALLLLVFSGIAGITLPDMPQNENSTEIISWYNKFKATGGDWKLIAPLIPAALFSAMAIYSRLKTTFQLVKTSEAAETHNEKVAAIATSPATLLSVSDFQPTTSPTVVKGVDVEQAVNTLEENRENFKPKPKATPPKKTARKSASKKTKK